MRRSVPLLVPCGVIAIVMGLGLIHAHIAVPAYSFGGRRLVWALSYSALLAVAAYAVGLPDVPRRARQVATAAAGASIGGAIGISLLQLTAGDALLPRFVVFGALELVLAAPAVLSMRYLVWSDLTWGTTMMPVGSALAVVAMAWFIGRARALEEIGRRSRMPVGLVTLISVR